MSPKPFAVVSICLAIAVALCGTASASTRQVAIFQDEHQLLERGESVQVRTLDELQGLGVDVIKVQAKWGEIAPLGRTKPSGFDATDPAAYGSRWGPLDSLVPNAEARGFDVMIALTGPAPGRATAKRGDRVGWNWPSGTEFGPFAEAAGRRCPSVHHWGLWNEPQHPKFLY